MCDEWALTIGCARVDPVMPANVFRVDSDGPKVASEADALGLLYAEGADEAEWIAVPAERLDPAFFDLGSGLAGGVLQKFANHRVGLAVVGDISAHVAASPALRDFVREANRGRQVWFLADEAELQARFAGADAAQP